MQITELVRGESKMQEPEKAPKWVNRMFSKSGKAYFTNRLWDTQELAEAAVQKDLNKAKEFLQNGEILVWDYEQGDLSSDEYSWHMQIPILQD